jgi:hypothetical protein
VRRKFARETSKGEKERDKKVSYDLIDSETCTAAVKTAPPSDSFMNCYQTACASTEKDLKLREGARRSLATTPDSPDIDNCFLPASSDGHLLLIFTCFQ